MDTTGEDQQRIDDIEFHDGKAKHIDQEIPSGIPHNLKGSAQPNGKTGGDGQSQEKQKERKGQGNHLTFLPDVPCRHGILRPDTLGHMDGEPHRNSRTESQNSQVLEEIRPMDAESTASRRPTIDASTYCIPMEGYLGKNGWGTRLDCHHDLFAAGQFLPASDQVGDMRKRHRGHAIIRERQIFTIYSFHHSR